jgi:hypothetical protein
MQNNTLDIESLRRTQIIADALAKYRNNDTDHRPHKKPYAKSLLFFVLGLFSGSILGFFSCASVVLLSYFIPNRFISHVAERSQPEPVVSDKKPKDEVGISTHNEKPIDTEVAKEDGPEQIVAKEEPETKEESTEELTQPARQVTVVQATKRAPKKKPWEK